MTTDLLAHSRIGASSMHRWAECPGSVRLSAGIPNRSSKYAEEGTEAHEVAAKLLSIQGIDLSKVDLEMLEAVEVYTDAVMADSVGCKLLVEHRFDLTSIHPGLFGTCDAIIFDEKNKTLKVYDYKHGAGIPVEVFEDGKGNPQLMYYGLGALLSTSFPCDTVELVIVQPRCPHSKGVIRRWSCPSIDLLDFAADLKEFAMKTEAPDAVLVPGDHCRFCPASGICPAIKNKAQVMAKQVFSTPATVGVDLYEPAKLSEVLGWLPVLDSWIKSVRDFAYAEVESGKVIPGWKLVEKRKTRKWTDEIKITQYLESEFPMSARDFYEHSLKSVAQVEKFLHKKQHEKLIPFITAASSGTTLVSSDDPRPEVKVMELKKAEFLKLSEEADLLS